MVRLLNSLYLGASTLNSYGNAKDAVELLPLEYYLGSAVPHGGTNYIDVILSGVSPLVLTNAIEDGLNYLKLFGGTEQRNIPSEYTQVEYLESSGTQYIDTGIVLKSVATITTVAQANTFTSSGPFTFWGFMGNGTMPRWGWSIYQNKWLTDLNATSQIQVLADTNKHIFKNTCYYNNNDLQYDSLLDGNSLFASAQLVQSPSTYTSNTLSAYLFARNINGTASNFLNCRIFSYEIVQDGVKVINLIPCKRNSDNVLGMYDTVTGNFLTNAGTGTFTAGADVVPTPETPIDIWCNNGVLKLSPNLVDFNETRINSSTWNSADKTKGFEVYADVYGKSVGDTMLTNANVFGVFVPCAYGKSVSMNFFNYSPYPNRAVYCEITEDGKCNTSPAIYYNTLSDTWNNYTFTITQPDSIGFVIEWYVSGDKVRNYTKENYMIISGTTQPTVYIPYGQIYTDGTVEIVGIRAGNLVDNSILGVNINTSGEIVSSSATFIVHTAPVTPGETYTCNEVSTFAYYTSKPDIGSVSYNNNRTVSTNTTFTVPNDPTIKYVAFRNSSNDSWLVKGSTKYNGGTATAEMLLKVGDYQDEQSVTSGAVTRNIGVLVLDGTENWSVAHAATYTYTVHISEAAGQSSWSNLGGLCSHLSWYVSNTTPSYTNTNPNTLWFNPSRDLRVKTNSNFATLTDWTNYLKAQYNAGTPVIVVYPLAEPTTESVTGQPLSVQTGTNILTITQASIDNLTMEISYKTTS